METIRQLIIILLLLLTVTPIFATLRYVSVAGNDITGDGTSGNPWKSLYKACNTVSVVGDTIFIQAGYYTETSTSYLNVGINIMGAGRNLVTITSNITNNYLIILNSASNPNQQGNQFISGITFNGNALVAKYCIQVSYRGGVTIKDCIIQDFYEGGVMFRGYTNQENVKQEPSVWMTNNKFINNITYNNSKANKSPYTPWYTPNLWLTGQDGFLCYGNTMYENERPGDGGDCIGQHTSKRLKIYNNTLVREAFVNGIWHFVIELRYNYGEIEVYGNTMDGESDITYIWNDALSYGLKFYSNLCGPAQPTYSGDVGLQLEADVHDVEIYNNTFKNVYAALYISSTTTGSTYMWNHVENVIFRNNLCYNMTPWFYNPWWILGNGVYMTGISSTTWNNIYIWNNTFTSVTSGQQGSQSGIRLPTGGVMVHCEIKNNVFKGFQNANLYLSHDGSYTVSVDSLWFINNCSYQNGHSNTPSFVDVPTHYFNLNNLIQDPLLKANYKLNKESPCVDAGINVGLTYNGSYPDIGAFEYTEETRKIIKLVGRLIKTTTDPTGTKVVKY